MTKCDYIKEIEMLLVYMTPFCTKSGVDLSKYIQEFEKRTVPQLKEGHKWLQERLPAIESYRKVRILLSDEIWDAYKHMDSEDFREVQMLNAAIKEIKKVFVGRPVLFRKAKDAGKCKGSGSPKSRDNECKA